MPARDEVETVKSAETMFDVINTLCRMDGARLIDIVNELQLAKSTVYRHLKTLEKHEFIVSEDNRYYLGLRFLQIGHLVQNRNQAFQVAEEIVNDLAERTGERAQFLVEEHGKVVCIHRETGDHGVVADSKIGKERPIHATSGGKAILSEMSTDRVNEILDHQNLDDLTKNTTTDKAELYDELETIRDRGWAYNNEEYIPGLRAVAVPVNGPDDDVLGALTISGPSNRLVGDVIEKKLPTLLLGAANELELNIQYP